LPMSMRPKTNIARNWMPCTLLAGALLVASGNVGAQSCTFRTPLPSLIQFGTLDPSLASDVNASTSASVQCTAGARSPDWTFAGSHGNAPLRLKHATQDAYIPYAVTASYVTGGVGNQQWNITATILGANYQNARVGAYSDLLIMQISP
jgi:hypothetical protein